MATTLQGRARGTNLFEEFSGSVSRRKYTHTYWVTSDDPDNDTEETVKATANLPQMGEAYSVDSGASVIAVRGRQDKVRRNVWYVDVEYDSEIDVGQGGQGGGGGSGATPTDLSPEIEYDFETLNIRRPKDAFGKPYTTSAGEDYEGGGIVLPSAVTVLTYSRWQTSFSGATIQAYVNKVNHAPFSGANAFEVLMAGIRARLRPVIGTRLWWVTYVMKWNPESWQIFLEDKGHFSGSLAAPVYPKVASARGRTVLVALDGSGGVSLTGTPATNVFNPYLTANFAALGF